MCIEIIVILQILPGLNPGLGSWDFILCWVCALSKPRQPQLKGEEQLLAAGRLAAESHSLLSGTGASKSTACTKARPPASAIAATGPCFHPSTNWFTCWHFLIFFRDNRNYYHKSEHVPQPKIPHGFSHLSSILYAEGKPGFTKGSGPPLLWGYQVPQAASLKTYPNVNLLSNAHVLFVQWKTLNRTPDNCSVCLLPK